MPDNNTGSSSLSSDQKSAGVVSLGLGLILGVLSSSILCRVWDIEWEFDRYGSYEGIEALLLTFALCAGICCTSYPLLRKMVFKD